MSTSYHVNETYQGMEGTSHNLPDGMENPVNIGGGYSKTASRNNLIL